MGRPKKQPVSSETTETVQSTVSNLDALKQALRAKYYDLKEDKLEFEDRNSLIEYVCRVLGMNKPALEVVIEGFHLA